MIYKIILFIICAFIFFLFFHIITTRYNKRIVSHQKTLIILILLYNLPILLFSSLLFKSLSIFLYIFLVLNCLMYFYFHIFNMSETSRGIKIILNVKIGKIQNIVDINNIYIPEDSLTNRLKRLEHLKQIEKKSDKNYLLKGKTFYLAALMILFFRKILKIES